MVDVGAKPITERMARASSQVTMSLATAKLIQEGTAAKGDVLGIARLAGIMGAKQTSQLIPLCHPLSLDQVEVKLEFVNKTTLQIESLVRVQSRTGVEMEALTAASVAALTVYDMCKSVDRGMTICSVRLEEKVGGKSGHFIRDKD